MKAIVKIGLWKAIAFLAAAVLFPFSFSGCCHDDDPDVPDTLFLPAVTVLPAINITLNSATFIGLVVPFEPNTRVAFDYRLSSETVWQNKSVEGTFSGTDSVRFTLNVTGLKTGSEYVVRSRGYNKAGEVISTITTTFSTYALSDYDGNLYHTIKIGNQVWLQENFKGTHFANGDPIPNVTDQSAWNAMTTPAYCWYNNDPKIGEVYGGLYNFYVANDPRGLIAGFHTPSLDEWIILANYLGGSEVAGGAMKEAGYDHWIRPNAGATNSSKFNGLPSGVRQEKFSNLGDGVAFWTTTDFGIPGLVFATDLGQSSSRLQLAGGSYFYYAYSIRLMQN